MYRFLKTKQNYYKKSIPTTKYQQITGLTILCKDLYSVRSKRSVQPYTHKERREIENCL
jgi:hypothetical protein